MHCALFRTADTDNQIDTDNADTRSQYQVGMCEAAGAVGVNVVECVKFLHEDHLINIFGGYKCYTFA